MHKTGRPLVVVTGGAGGVARLLRPRLHADYELRLTDRHPVEPTSVSGEQEMLGDLSDASFAAKAMTDATAMVHLAGNPSPRASWAQAGTANLDLTVAVLEAARRAGVRRVVYASSVHATGRYALDGDWPVDPGWPAKPCCAYGVSKAAAEIVGQYYANTYGMTVICLRLGWTRNRPHTKHALTCWLSPTDLGRLVTAALETDRRFGIYFGTSANRRSHWDIGNARSELGYVPVDDADDYADSIPADSSDQPACQADAQSRAVTGRRPRPLIPLSRFEESARCHRLS